MNAQEIGKQTREIYEANGDVPAVYVETADDSLDCVNCGATPEHMDRWYGVIDDREGGFIAYFGTKDDAEAFAATVRATLTERPYDPR